MTLITTTADLSAFCDRLASPAYVTVDTKFMREKTYYPQLCLVQVAGPDEAAAIDPPAEGIDLAPLFGLLANPAVLEVLHAPEKRTVLPASSRRRAPQVWERWGYMGPGLDVCGCN